MVVSTESDETPPHVTVVEPQMTEVTYGEETYEVRQYKDGGLGCPKCKSICDGKRGLRSHLSLSHGDDGRVTRECNHCGEEFRLKAWDDRQHCSRECGYAAQSGEANTEICKRCGDEFAAPPSQDPKFCSRECYEDYRIPDETEVCDGCGEEFIASPSQNQQYCSRECYHESTRAPRYGELE